VETGGRARRNPAWRIRAGEGLSPPRVLPGRKGLYVAPPGGAVSIPVRFGLETRRPTDVRLHVVYERQDLRIEASGWVKVGRDRDTFLRACAISLDPDRREFAVRIIRYQLKKRDKRPGFAAGLRAAGLSPHADVRLGVARALVDHGWGVHKGMLVHLAADRDMDVASAALAGIPGHVDLANAPRELHRIAARCLVSRAEWRPAAIRGMLGRVPQRTRHRFLADLLASSRTPAVHAAVVAMVGREGIPLGTDGATGLVPRSQIENLRG